MSFFIAGATVVGAGISAHSANKASKRAEKASDAQIAFEQEKYDDWQETYGPIQDNLADYYNNLSPEYYEVQGLEAFEQERAVAMQQIEENLAQRGITDSGVAASISSQEKLQAAQTRAGIRTAAPIQAADEKMRFLQVGLGRSPGESMSRTLAERTRASEAEATAQGRVAGQAIGAAVTTVGTALADYNTEGKI